MSRVCLVTALADDAPLAWGLDPARLSPPAVLLCNEPVADVLRRRGAPPHVRIVSTNLPPELSPRDRLALLRQVCDGADGNADFHYWVDVVLLYRDLSFEFFYSGVLESVIAAMGGDAVYFEMPGHLPFGFFGGPNSALQSAFAARVDDPAELFETTRGAHREGALFRPAFDTERAEDLNLMLSRHIREPLVHVIGDSHVLSCFTPNCAIGCRSHVLVPTREVSDTEVPYAYQFTHHLGSRTMHHAGRPGALAALARQCRVEAGDAVVWVFGEIDVRCHVLKQHEEEKRPLDEVIATLTRDYVDGILEVRDGLAPARQIVFAPIPPLDNPNYASVDLPVHGGIEARVDATRRVRAALAELCAANGLALLDVGDEFRTERGDLRWELSDQFCHISSTYQEPIVSELYHRLRA